MIIRENKIENYKKFAGCLLSNLKCEVRCSSVLRNDCAIAASVRYDRCCLSMGRREGKTTFALIHGIRQALKRSGSNIVIYVANESCIKICQERMAGMLNPLYLVSHTCGNKYQLINDSTITIRQTIDTETNYDLVIIDDICSKGFTFYYAGQKLRDLGASDVRLYITHCEDNIKNGEVLKTDVISKVYTTDSICHIEDEKIEFIRKFRAENLDF